MKGRKKIAIVIASVLQAKFFLEPHLALLADKYDVTLIVNDDHPQILAQMRLPVSVVIVPIARKIALIQDLRALKLLIKIFSREGFDLVHTMNPKAGLLGMIAAKITQVPIRIHTFQGEVWATMSGAKRQFFILLDRFLAALASNLLVVSSTEKAYLMAHHIFSGNKAQVLANGSIGGVDLKKFFPNSELRQSVRQELGISGEVVVLLYMGRLTKEKGVFDLGAAFSKLQEQIKQPILLLMVGPDEDRVRAQFIKDHPLCGGAIRFMEYTSSPQNYMAASDILVLPSYREGFGVVVIEAAAMGVPCVASDIYGIQDAVEANQTGLLFKLGDQADFLGKLKRLILDPVQREVMGQRARARVVTSFDQQFVLKEFLNFYEQLFAEKAVKAQNQVSSFMKRSFDIFLSSFALILLAIPILLVALLVRLTSKGPVLYWSSRVGVNGDLFQMPKFRSMKVNAPVVATHLLSNPQAHLTSIGGFLRKSSLDELPQLWNILIGDMSFVGPRPALFNQDDLIEARRSLGIDRIQPGLTGWAQVNGRDEISLEKKLRLDEQYLRRQGFWFDCYILWLTFWRVIRSESVSH